MKKANQEELQYTEFSPRISRKMQLEVKIVNERDEKIERRRKVISVLGAVGLAIFAVTSFYFFAVALFTYGASF